MSDKAIAAESPKDDVSDAPVVDMESAADAAAATLPPEPSANFPKIRRQLWDVYRDDERNEIWVGIKCRFTAKGRTREGGPIEDLELNHDSIAIITSLDAAKQEAVIALAKDTQELNEKRPRRAALQGNGLLDRLSAGLGRAVTAGKSLIH